MLIIQQIMCPLRPVSPHGFGPERYATYVVKRSSRPSRARGSQTRSFHTVGINQSFGKVDAARLSIVASNLGVCSRYEADDVLSRRALGSRRLSLSAMLLLRMFLAMLSILSRLLVDNRFLHLERACWGQKNDGPRRRLAGNGSAVGWADGTVSPFCTDRSLGNSFADI